MSIRFQSSFLKSVLFLASVSLLPFSAQADLVNRCSKLERSVTTQRAAVKKLMSRKAPRARLARQISQLKKAQSSHRRAGCSGKVCGDMQPTLCNGAADCVAIQVLMPKTFSSLAEMSATGARLLHRGACSSNEVLTPIL